MAILLVICSTFFMSSVTAQGPTITSVFRQEPGGRNKKGNASFPLRSLMLVPPTFLILSHWSVETAMAPHSSTLAWKIPWTEERGRLQSMGLLRVGHDWATLLSLFSFMHWRRKWQPTPVFLPGESQGQGAWWAAVSGVAQSRTRLKRLSSSSSSSSIELEDLPKCSKKTRNNICTDWEGRNETIFVWQ